MHSTNSGGHLIFPCKYFYSYREQEKKEGTLNNNVTQTSIRYDPKRLKCDI